MSSACISHTPFQKRDRQKGIDRGGPPAEVERHDVIIVQKPKPDLPDDQRLNTLAKELGAEPFKIEAPCVDDACPRNALDRVFERLAELDKTRGGNVRILHLGDSHVAADYITGTIRSSLQYRFGDAGRGFVAVDQRAEYGGRRVHKKGWKRTRIVDQGRAGMPFGFSGMSLESQRSGAKVTFALFGEDASVTVFYHATRNGSMMRVMVDELVIGEIDTYTPSGDQSRARTFKIPGSGGGGKRSQELALVAEDSGAKVFGLSFDNGESGISYDAIGPVGADARVYMSLNQKSLKEHLQALKPDLIVMMVGGNDALAMRRGRSLEDVRTDHERVLQALKTALPEADCMLWSPMDAGEMERGQIVSKKFISEVRNMQRAAATKMGCAFWDMFESMGSEGSFARWHKAGIMNDDLVHPRAQAGQLLGHLFATSFIEAFTANR